MIIYKDIFIAYFYHTHIYIFSAYKLLLSSIYIQPFAVNLSRDVVTPYCYMTGGRDRYIKKKDSLQQQVPDLDDMTGDGLVNGTKELVFDMDQLGL